MMRPHSSSKKNSASKNNSGNSSKLFGSGSKLFNGNKSIRPTDLVRKPNFVKTLQPDDFIIEDDEETKQEVTYTNYLIALMRQKLLQEKFDNELNELEDQLSLQMQIIEDKSREVQELEQACRLRQGRKAAENRLIELEKTTNQIVEINEEHKVEENVETITKMLQLIKDKILLCNVDMLTTQEQYAKWKCLLNKCLAVSRNLVNCFGDTSELHKLSEEIENALTSEKNLREINNQLEKTAICVVEDGLKDISDMIAIKNN